MGIFNRKRNLSITEDIADRLEQKGFEKGTLLSMLTSIDDSLSTLIVEGKFDRLKAVCPFEDENLNRAFSTIVHNINYSMNFLAENIGEEISDKYLKHLTEDMAVHGEWAPRADNEKED